VPGWVGSPKPDRDLDRHAGAVRVGADNGDCQVIGLGEDSVERDRPRKLVVGRAHGGQECGWLQAGVLEQTDGNDGD
jgi:hypothetical protein